MYEDGATEKFLNKMSTHKFVLYNLSIITVFSETERE